MAGGEKVSVLNGKEGALPEISQFNLRYVACDLGNGGGVRNLQVVIKKLLFHLLVKQVSEKMEKAN